MNLEFKEDIYRLYKYQIVKSDLSFFNYAEETERLMNLICP